MYIILQDNRKKKGIEYHNILLHFLNLNQELSLGSHKLGYFSHSLSWQYPSAFLVTIADMAKAKK